MVGVTRRRSLQRGGGQPTLLVSRPLLARLFLNLAIAAAAAAALIRIEHDRHSIPAAHAKDAPDLPGVPGSDSLCPHRVVIPPLIREQEACIGAHLALPHTLGRVVIEVTGCSQASKRHARG